jgi:ABC-2 type transport system ATP-binding protein
LRSIDALKLYEEIKDAAVYGAGIHALLEPGVPLQQLHDYLTAQNIDVFSMEKVMPSLEDVFVFLVEKEKRLSR